MLHVLLIENDSTLRGALLLTLNKKDYKVTEAENGVQGLPVARDQQVDLVITDLIMPGTEGRKPFVHSGSIRRSCRSSQ